MALLEPIMQVEMFVPDTYMGDAIADLNARGGKVESIAAKSGIQIIHAVVPLAKMFRLFHGPAVCYPGQGNL
jgi:elongation factor G